MSFKDDRDEFNTSGICGLLRTLMSTKDEAFIREHMGGWQGEVVPVKPPKGSGPYLHFKKGEGVVRCPNESPTDDRVEPFRVEL